LSDFGEIKYEGSEQNAVQHLWVLWKSMQGRPHFA